MFIPAAADLPAIEPDDDDLHALERLSWQDSQEHIESLLAEAALLPVRRAVVAPIRGVIRHAHASSAPSGGARHIQHAA